MKKCRLASYPPLVLSAAALCVAFGCEQRAPDRAPARTADETTKEQPRKHAPQEDAEPASRSEDQANPAAELCWNPSLIDATLGSPIDDMRLTQPAALHFCGSEEPGSEDPIAKFNPDNKILKDTLTDSEKHAFVLYQDPNGKYVVDAFETQTGEHTGRCPVNVVKRLPRHASLNHSYSETRSLGFVRPVSVGLSSIHVALLPVNRPNRHPSGLTLPIYPVSEIGVL